MRTRFWNRWGIRLLLAGAGAFAAAQEPPFEPDAPPGDIAEPRTPAPRVELSTTSWDFGTVWQGEDVKTEVTIKNVGTAPLELKVKSSCGCTVASKPKSPLPPGASDTMTVRYDAKRRTGPTRQTITLTTNDPARQTVSLVVRGTVKPMYHFEPLNSLSFGRMFEDSAVTRTIEIFNQYDQKMHLKLKDGQDFGPYDVRLKTLEQGEHYALSATTRTPVPVGTAKAEVILLTGFERLPEIRVVVYGIVQPPIRVHPARLYWVANAPSGMERRLRFAYAPGKPVKILAARSTCPAVTVEIEDVAPASAETNAALQEVIVHLPPGDQAPDADEVTVEVMTDSANPAYRKLVVPIRVMKPQAPARPPQKGPATRPARPVGPESSRP